RHHIYYFRWPLPKGLSPIKPDYIRVSLRTREPQEALRLSRLLEYHASYICDHYGRNLMNNKEAREIVQRYCQQILAERKRQIEEAGGLPDASLALQKEAQELVGNYE